MIEKIICDADDLVAIADAVRASTGETDLYTVPELSIAAVNVIEGAAAGAKLATCTVHFTSENAASGLQRAIYFTLDEQGNAVVRDESFSKVTSQSFQVLCNSVICLRTPYWYGQDIYSVVVAPSKAECFRIGETWYYELFHIYAGEGETVHIHNQHYDPESGDAPL